MRRSSPSPCVRWLPWPKHRRQRPAGLVYLWGQTAKGSASAEAGIAEQTAEVLARIDALLVEAGSDRSRIFTTTIYLRDIAADFAGMDAFWEAWLAHDR